MENIDSIEKYYVNVFDTKEDLNNKIGEMFLQDDVSLDATLSYVKNEKLCYSLSKNVDWFYVEAIENDTKITFENTWFGNKKDIISYSENGFVFFPLTNINNGIALNSGDRVYFKSISYAGKTNYENYENLSLAFAYVSKNFKVGGDIQKSLNIRNMRECAMHSMFKNTKLTDANNLKLPATTLAENCYSYMFNGCTSLKNAPALPATTLADYCYNSMFEGCTSLETAPALPTTTLAKNCYVYMFNGCNSLVNAPELPATTLAEDCYSNMFRNCTILETAPELPATTLAENCYSYMFNGCNSLVNAPELPATTLAENCYSYMFDGCTSLVNAPELPATTLVHNCYTYMFGNCINLKYITCLATNIEFQISDNQYSTYNWVEGVSDSGKFTKSAEASEDFWSIGTNGIPTDWVIKTKI